MNEENLSPAARKKLKELTPPIDCGENWFIAYDKVLRDLAERKIPPFEDVEIKNRGIKAWEQSRAQHAIEVELKAYAIAFLGPDNSAEIAKLPAHATLDDFLKRTMPNTGKQVLRERFRRFLIENAESECDRQIQHSSKSDLSRAESAKRMADYYFTLYDEEGLYAPSQYEVGQAFRKWWKSQSDGNPLESHNRSKRMGVAERHLALIALLPSRPNKPGITKEKWCDLAKKNGLFSSLRSFNRDVLHLTDSKMIQVQDNGNFRQIPK